MGATGLHLHVRRLLDWARLLQGAGAGAGAATVDAAASGPPCESISTSLNLRRTRRCVPGQGKIPSDANCNAPVIARLSPVCCVLVQDVTTLRPPVEIRLRPDRCGALASRPAQKRPPYGKLNLCKVERVIEQQNQGMKGEAVVAGHDQLGGTTRRALRRMLLVLVMLRPLLSMWPGSVGTGSSSTVTSLRSRTRRSYADRRFGSRDRTTCGQRATTSFATSTVRCYSVASLQL